jgi:GNAT superfamily N-acetyltransferase
MHTHQVSVRRATEADLPRIAEFLRHMLADMAAVGGHPVSTAPEQWKTAEAEFHDHLQAPDCLHLLAEVADTQPSTLGWAFARSTEREPMFESVRLLHISALYVSPAYRRRGIGRTLLAATLDWGRSIGCTEAELNVLIDNPARSLYRDLGFRAFEIEMTRKL